MNNRFFPALIIVLISFSASAQSDTVSQRSWFVSIHTGVLMAKPGNGTSVTTTLMPGIRLGRLAMAVGAGYDVYQAWRALPVFAGVGYDIHRGRNYSFFVHFNAGYSKGWISTPEGESGSTFKNEGGYFYHPFAGYRISQGKINIYVSAGYKFQTLSYEQQPQWFWGTGMKSTVTAEMQRLSLQIGFGI
jgi:hypothetical protein